MKKSELCLYMFLIFCGIGAARQIYITHKQESIKTAPAVASMSVPNEAREISTNDLETFTFTVVPRLKVREQ